MGVLLSYYQHKMKSSLGVSLTDAFHINQVLVPLIITFASRKNYILNDSDVSCELRQLLVTSAVRLSSVEK